MERSDIFTVWVAKYMETDQTDARTDWHFFVRIRHRHVFHYQALMNKNLVVGARGVQELRWKITLFLHHRIYQNLPYF